MRTGFFCLSLIVTFAFSIENAKAQQTPGIQPTQPQPPPQQQSQVQYQQQQYQPIAPGTAYASEFFQGAWVSSCIVPAPIPQFWPHGIGPTGAPGNAIGPNVFRQYQWYFDGASVAFVVGEFRDPSCVIPLGEPHKEVGTWITTFVDPRDPTAAELRITFDACGGVGCKPYNPDVGPYSIVTTMIHFIDSWLELGQRLPYGHGNDWAVEAPLYVKGHEPTALHTQQYQQR